jgi:hypothetical protein
MSTYTDCVPSSKHGRLIRKAGREVDREVRWGRHALCYTLSHVAALGNISLVQVDVTTDPGTFGGCTFVQCVWSVLALAFL